MKRHTFKWFQTRIKSTVYSRVGTCEIKERIETKNDAILLFKYQEELNCYYYDKLLPGKRRRGYRKD